MDKAIQEAVAKYGDSQWINTFTSKGPIIIQNKDEPWFLFDVKVHRDDYPYPYVNYRNRLVLTGGNWRQMQNQPSPPQNPRELYKLQLREELGQLADELSDGPFADYLEVARNEDHGNPKMKDVIPATAGDMYAVVSVFGSTVDGERLQYALQIPSSEFTLENVQRKIKSAESGSIVLRLTDLRNGRVNAFAFGDEGKLADFVSERYGIEIHGAITRQSGSNYRLSTSPLTPYSERAELLRYLRVNPLRTQVTDPKSPFTPI